MTGDDAMGVATTRQAIPEIAAAGVIAAWSGALRIGPDGPLFAALGPAAEAAVAGSGGSSPAVLMLGETPPDGASVIPWSMVDRVVLPTEEDVAEFNARAYDNFEPSAITAEARPGTLCGGEGGARRPLP